MTSWSAKAMEDRAADRVRHVLRLRMAEWGIVTAERLAEVTGLAVSVARDYLNTNTWSLADALRLAERMKVRITLDVRVEGWELPA